MNLKYTRSEKKNTQKKQQQQQKERQCGRGVNFSLLLFCLPLRSTAVLINLILNIIQGPPGERGDDGERGSVGFQVFLYNNNPTNNLSLLQFFATELSSVFLLV